MNVGQVKDVTIYDRAMSDNFMNAVMRKSSIIQIINYFSLTVKQRVAFHHILPIRIPLILIVNITGKLSHSFRLVPLRIPFDKPNKVVDTITQVPKICRVQ